VFCGTLYLVMEATAQLKYCLYARKSSEQDERQTMSIDSQIKEMQDMAVREGLNVVEIKQESHSAKQSGQRPVFLELIADLRSDKFQGVLTWAPDRLSRNAGDLGSLVDLMDSNHLVHIRTYGQSFSNTPNEKFLLMILCSQAKLENDNRGVNVKRGIRAKCEMGWRPCMPPIGYYNRAFNGVKDIIEDPERAPYIKEMFERVAIRGDSGRTVKKWLDKQGFTTRSGAQVTLSQIYLMLKNPFYYGAFEYPKKSGKWYDGSHPKLVSKELYDKVQNQLTTPRKAKWGMKEFAYRGLINCAGCGSQITGEEHFKKRIDGGVNRHVYYHCTRQIDYECKEPYIRQDDLETQLKLIISELPLRMLTVNEKLRYELIRYKAMTTTFATDVKGDDNRSAAQLMHEYSSYIICNGTEKQKAVFIGGLSLKLLLHSKKLNVL
jgi:site-specific DNA recombinase